MIRIVDGVVTIEGSSGSNYYAGQEYFLMTEKDGTKVRIHMSIIEHCLVVLKHDTKFDSIQKLLRKRNLWGDKDPIVNPTPSKRKKPNLSKENP